MEEEAVHGEGGEVQLCGWVGQGPEGCQAGRGAQSDGRGRPTLLGASLG